MTLHEALLAAVPFLDQAPPPPNPPETVIPDIGPQRPDWAGKVEELVANIRWFSGLGLLACFFLGVLVWSAGRGVDNHRAGRVGTVMMLVGVFGGLAWSLGYTLISTMAR